MLGSAVAGAAESRGPFAQHEILEVAMAGHELRFVLETARTTTGLIWQETRWANVRGWLVCADLSADSPFMIRPEAALAVNATGLAKGRQEPPLAMPPLIVRDNSLRLFGPLWSTPGQRLMLHMPSVYVGESALAQRNRRLGRTAPPYVGMNEHGTPVRVRVHPQRDDGFLRDEFDPAEQLPHWRGESFYPALEGTPRIPAINAAGYLLYAEPSGEFAAYEFLSGHRVRSEWLDGALAVFQALPHLQRFERAWLTEDAQYLVFSLAKWETEDVSTLPGRGPRFTNFTVGGQTYSRATHSLYFRRPETAPRVFKREADGDPDSSLGMNPRAALSIDGELRLLNLQEGRLWLSAAEGGVTREIALPGGARWLTSRRIQHLPAEGRVVLIVVNEDVRVFDWNYRTGQGSEFRIAAPDAFEPLDGDWRPRVKPIAVK